MRFSADCVPLVHGSHEVAPAAACALPGAHRTHDVAPDLLLIDPGAQESHRVAPVGWSRMLPVSQVVQLVDPSVEKVASGQSVQPVNNMPSEELEYFPASHESQLVAAVKALRYEPALQ